MKTRRYNLEQFDILEIDFQPKYKERKIAEDVLCGVFHFQGLREDIEEIAARLRQRSESADEVVMGEYVTGIYEVSSALKKQPWSFYQELIRMYPGTKVHGLCARLGIREVYSESGYEYITYTSSTIMKMDRDFDEWPEWFNKVAELYNPNAESDRYFMLTSIGWALVDFVVEQEGIHYSVIPKQEFSKEDFAREIKIDVSLKACRRDWKIESVGECYRLVKYKGNESAVYIPGTVLGKPVIIGRDIFEQKKTRFNVNIQRIIVGDGAIAIERNAFSSCIFVKSIRLPETIDYVGSGIVDSCFLLQHDVMTSKILIGIRPTLNRHVYNVPEGIEVIAGGAFGITSIDKFSLPKSLKSFKSLPYGVKQFIFPEQIKTLEPEAFCVHTKLEEVVIPSNLTEIPESTFFYCQNLKKVLLPESVERIGRGAFEQTHPLCQLCDIQLPDTQGVIIPPTVKVVEEDNFDCADKIIVFDTLEQWSFRHATQHEGRDKNYIIEVYRAEDYQLKYKIWAAFVGESDQVREIFNELWCPGEEIDFEKYDRAFKLYRKIENKMLYTIMRLRYPYKLDEGHQDRLLKYYQRHREQAKKFFVSKFNKEALKVMAELDEMLSLENKEPNLNLEQKKPYELMNKGYNVFLTGATASGKTHLLREFVEMQWLKGHNVVSCAPSGKSAFNIKGVSIHEAFQISASTVVSENIHVPQNILDADVIVIDDINMCRMDVFDYLSYCILLANQERGKKGKPKIQLIVAGDFYQLSPIVSKEDRNILNKKYGYDVGNAYAFQSKYWEQFDFCNITLKGNLIQTDPDFATALNQVREGDRTCIKYFNEKTSQVCLQKGIYLYSTNAKANALNDKGLEEIQDEEIGFFYSKEEIGITESNRIAEKVLKLKCGARVVLLIDDEENNLRKGSLGTVFCFGEDWVTVILDSGMRHSFSRYCWKVNKQNVVSVKQFPLKLGYATTIYKSKDFVFDKVNIEPKVWAQGQLYMMLSKVKNVQDMHLLYPLRESMFMVDPRVVEFYKKCEHEAKK